MKCGSFEVRADERQIRQELHRELAAQHAHDPQVLIIHELSVCQGKARIDVALIDTGIHGYEIKGYTDNLSRLPRQVSIYNRVCDTATVVVAEQHLQEVVNIVPD